jgi:hypothetical protein
LTWKPWLEEDSSPIGEWCLECKQKKRPYILAGESWVVMIPQKPFTEDQVKELHRYLTRYSLIGGKVVVTPQCAEAHHVIPDRMPQVLKKLVGRRKVSGRVETKSANKRTGYVGTGSGFEERKR